MRDQLTRFIGWRNASKQLVSAHSVARELLWWFHPEAATVTARFLRYSALLPLHWEAFYVDHIPAEKQETFRAAAPMINAHH